MVTGRDIQDDTKEKFYLGIFGILVFSGFGWFLFYATITSKHPFGLENFTVKNIWSVIGELLMCFLIIIPPVFFLGVLLHFREYGFSILTLDQNPVKLGSQVAGQIIILKPIKDFTRINLKVFCYKHVVGTKYGKSYTLLWEFHQSVDSQSVQSIGERTMIPVAFLIPADCQPTRKIPRTLFRYETDIEWSLEIKAVSQRGLNFCPKFNLQVVA